MIVFVTEKPMAARALAQLAAQKYPDQHIFTLEAHPYSTFAFNYGRGYLWNQYPRTDFTRYTVRRDAPLWIHEITDGKVVALFEQDRERAARELLVKSDQIVFAGDPDPSGAIGFRELLLHLTNLEQADRAHTALMLATMTEDDVALAFEQGETTNDAAFSRLCIYGEIKRYFDYNYNLNSLAILGKVFSEVCGTATQLPISKYALQLLYFLCDAGPMKESAVLKAMASWRGTGRYTADVGSPGLGSPASRTQIVVDLARNGLIDLSDKPETRNQTVTVTVTTVGHTFIEALHPDCRDADLPFRLHGWCEGDRLSSISAINRYIVTFFGKPKYRLDKR